MTTPHKALLIQARDALADHAMDAPVTDTPEQIVKSIIAMAVTMATDSTIAAGAVRSIPKGIRRKLLDELGAELECADGDEWDDAVVTMVENYLAAGAAPVPEGWQLVPVEPTPEMCDEGAQAIVQWENGAVWPDSWGITYANRYRKDAMKAYKAMLEAALKEPT